MEEKIYKITLGDGTEISNLKLNGNNFISTEKIEESVFADNCSPVTISDGTTETVHPNMELVQIVEQIPGNTGLSLEIFLRRNLPEPKCSLTSPTLQ